MNKLTIPSPSNGIKHFWDDLNYILGYGSYDSGLVQAVQGILKTFGDDFIVSGCEDLGGGITADGWIMLGGVLIRVKQHSRGNNYFAAITETNTTGDRTDFLGSSINVFQQNRATCSASSGNLIYNGNRLDEMLGLNITTKTISTAGGIVNIANNEKIIVIGDLTSTTTINLPTPSQYNKGVPYNFTINYSNDYSLSIVGESGALITFAAASSVVGVVGFMNDGTNWRLLYKSLAADDQVAGDIEILTNAEAKTGSDTTRAMTADGLAYATRNLAYTMSSGETYNVTSKIGVVIIPTGLSAVTINLPTGASRAVGDTIKIISVGTTTGSIDGGSAPATIISASQTRIFTYTGTGWSYTTESNSNIGAS